MSNDKKKSDVRKKGNDYGVKGNEQKKSGGKPRQEGEEKKSPKRTPWNDPAWYDRNPALTTGAANFSFNTALGIPTPTETIEIVKDATEAVIAEENVQIPGILAFRIHPTVGISLGTGSEPMNVAFQKMYTDTRKANSGSAPYEAVDEGLYLLRMDSIYSFHAWMARLYGTLTLYSAANRYMPKALVAANGVDFDDIIKHITALRDYINQYALKANTMKVPNVFTLLDRHYMMYGSYYKEEENNERAQIYAMVPEGFFRFAYNDDADGAGRLDYRHFLSAISYKTFDDIVEFGNSLIEAAFSDADVGIISGDILKAYGEDHCYGLMQLATDYTATLAYEPEMLVQLMNATCLGDTTWADDRIYQNENSKLVYNPSVQSNLTTEETGYYLPRGAWLNLRDPAKTDPAWILEFTRLTTTYEVGAIASTAHRIPFHIGSCGTEVVYSMGVYTINSITGAVNVTEVATYQPMHWNDRGSSYRWQDMLAFDYHGPIYWVRPDGEGDGPVMDFDNYRFITPKEKMKMDEVALLSQFDI